MGGPFSAKGRLDIYSIVRGPYKISNLKISLLGIYCIARPACGCLGRARPSDFTGRTVPTPAKRTKSRPRCVCFSSLAPFSCLPRGRCLTSPNASSWRVICLVGNKPGPRRSVAQKQMDQARVGACAGCPARPASPPPAEQCPSTPNPAALEKAKGQAACRLHQPMARSSALLPPEANSWSLQQHGRLPSVRAPGESPSGVQAS